MVILFYIASFIALVASAMAISRRNAFHAQGLARNGVEIRRSPSC